MTKRQYKHFIIYTSNNVYDKIITLEPINEPNETTKEKLDQLGFKNIKGNYITNDTIQARACLHDLDMIWIDRSIIKYVCGKYISNDIKTEIETALQAADIKAARIEPVGLNEFIVYKLKSKSKLAKIHTTLKTIQTLKRNVIQQTIQYKDPLDDLPF